MKKMFKKSIAMLIAVLMVISAMPFTAITASAADSTEKAYVKQYINAFDGYKATGNYTYNGTDLSKSDAAYYSNVLYDDGTFNDATQEGSNDYVYAKIYINNNVVMLYDGVNSTILPVVVRTWKTTNNMAAGQKYLHEISMEDETSLKSWQLKQDWTGGKGDSLGWPTGTTSLYYNQYNQGTSIYYDGKNTGYVWKNKLYYNGPQDKNATYEKMNSNITMIVHHSTWGRNTEQKLTLSNTTANIYVLNYAPIKQAITTMKAVYSRIQATGEENYCPDSLEAFYQAAYQIMAFNPNDYVYQSGVEGKVKEAAGKISDLVTYSVPKATTEPTKHNYGTPVSFDAKNHKYRCSVCGTEKLEAHDTLDGGKCSKCGYIALDLDAYNAANDVVLSILSNENKYTPESFAKYKAAILPHINKQTKFTSQDEVNAATYAIVSAEVLLQKKSVKITFVIEKEDGTSFTKDTKTADWGNPVRLDTERNYVSKWTITINGVTSKIDSNAKYIDHVATEDATITAYVSDEESDTVKYSKVTFLGKNSAVVGIKYVAVGTTVETNTLLTAPAIPFYEDGQWDKAEITADGSDITVRATYVPKAGDENKCGIHFMGDTKYYNYDSYVYLFNADKSKKYAMYADANETQLITYFDGVDFYAPRRDNLYIKEVTDTSAMTATIGFTGSYKQDTTSSFNVKFWLPEGATLVETGVDLVAKFPNGEVKSAHDRATKFSERNEYTYSAKFSDSQKTIEFKPYLTYKKGDTTTTVYGTSQTVKY